MNPLNNHADDNAAFPTSRLLGKTETRVEEIESLSYIGIKPFIVVSGTGGVEIKKVNPDCSLFPVDINLSIDERYIFTSSISPKNNIMFLGGSTSGLLVDIDKWKSLSRIMMGTTNYFKSSVFSPDGKYLFTGHEFDGQIRIWDVDRAKLIYSRELHSASINSVCCSEDGKLVASGDIVGSIWLSQFDNVNVTLDPYINTQGAPINCMAFIDNERIASGSDDGIVHVFDINSKKEVQRFETKKGKVNTILVNQDSRTLIAGYMAGNLIVWDIDTGNKIHDFFDFEGVEGIRAFCRISENQFISGGTNRTLATWNIRHSKEERLDPDYNRDPHKPIWKVNQTTLGEKQTNLSELATTFGCKNVRIIGQTLLGSKINVIRFANGGSKLWVGTKDGNISSFEIPTIKPINSFKGHLDSVNDLCLDNENTILLTCSDGSYEHFGGLSLAKPSCGENTLKIWGAQENNLISRFVGHDASVRSIEISSDGSMAVSASIDGVVIVWDLIENNEIARFETGQKVIKVLFSNMNILIGTQFGVQIWDYTSRKQKWETYIREITAISLLKTTSIVLAANPYEITYIDIETGKEIQGGHWIPGDKKINSISSTEDGLFYITGGLGRKVSFWKTLSSGEALFSLFGHESEIISVDIAQNNRLIASADRDGKIMLWGVDWEISGSS